MQSGMFRWLIFLFVLALSQDVIYMLASDWQSMGEHGKIKKELAANRARMQIRILADQQERLKKNKPLKTPKTKRVKIKFESTLREIEERKNHMMISHRKEKRQLRSRFRTVRGLLM